MAINKLLKDKLFRVYKNKELIMVVCNEKAHDMFDNTYKVVSVLEDNIEIKDLKQLLKDSGASMYDVLKTPHELLQEILGDDYLINPMFSNNRHTTYVVGENGFEFSFTISNNDYNVFEVNANGSGVFFCNRYLVKQWLDFLFLCETVRNIYYSVKDKDE